MGILKRLLDRLLKKEIDQHNINIIDTLELLEKEIARNLDKEEFKHCKEILKHEKD